MEWASTTNRYKKPSTMFAFAGLAPTFAGLASTLAGLAPTFAGLAATLAGLPPTFTGLPLKSAGRAGWPIRIPS